MDILYSLFDIKRVCLFYYFIDGHGVILFLKQI